VILQVGSINSLIRSKIALKAYAIDNTKGLDASEFIKTQLLDHRFWNNLEDVKEVLQLIHEQQKMSESNRAHLGYVVTRWKKIADHLRQLIARTNYPHADRIRTIFTPRPNAKGDLIHLWNDRFNKQVTDIHFAAYHLDPANQHIAATIDEEMALLGCLKRYTYTEEAFRATRKQYYQFKSRTGPWLTSNHMWSEMNDPLLFWQMSFAVGPHLATLAKRLYQTPANSVPSERAFSAMNFIHSKARNRLLVDRADMLQFLFMNDLVLGRRKDRQWRSWLTMTDDEEMDVEYRLQPTDTVVLGKHDREEYGDDEDTAVGQILARRPPGEDSWLSTMVGPSAVLAEP
jgi:hypothetical protein